MKQINSKRAGRILKRWGFYSEDQLAFAAIASRCGDDEVTVRCFESERHAHTAPLPERIAREQLVRDCARSDLLQAIGIGWQIRFEFDRRKLSANRLARTVFGLLPRGTTVPDGSSVT